MQILRNPHACCLDLLFLSAQAFQRGSLTWRLRLPQRLVGLPEEHVVARRYGLTAMIQIRSRLPRLQPWNMGCCAADLGITDSLAGSCVAEVWVWWSAWTGACPAYPRTLPRKHLFAAVLPLYKIY
jgi:hypothetical protein